MAVPTNPEALAAAKQQILARFEAFMSRHRGHALASVDTSDPHQRRFTCDTCGETMIVTAGDAAADPDRSFLRPEWERLMLELEEPATTHDRRAAIGDRLDQFGDPRPGVGVKPGGTPDLVWCEIPGGAVDSEGRGQFDVAPFSIAKYTITYRQYKAFIEDPNGYAKKAHWAGLERAAKPDEQHRRTGNHPADNVSWDDATAFCRWFSDRVGFETRLPHECEWQLAATGGPHYAYPWGPTWDPGRANTFESRLGRTTAVGMYPQGASAQGTLDLAGNVWEWCLDAYTKPRDRGKEAGRRLLRGGSWFLSGNLTRAAYRVDRDPGRPSHIGFRVVVCVSPIL